MYDINSISPQLAPDFNALLLAAIPSLLRQAMALTRHRADAEDPVQATVTNALAAQDSFQAGKNFRGWTTRILRNRFFSNVRSRRMMVDLDDPPAFLLVRSGSQEETIAVKELQHHLLRLPANQRQILMMISVDGLTYVDASKRLGVAVGTLKSRLFRARAQLQDWMLGTPPRRRCRGHTEASAQHTLASAVAAPASTPTHQGV
jgi:RNA polymerase sigma-70 factor (ECF subfamily)